MGAVLRTLSLAAALVAVLVSIVWERESLLKHGREIIVETAPIDPRDFFRGDYVILSYPFSRLETDAAVLRALRRGEPVHVVLARSDAAVTSSWSAVRVSAAMPETADHEVVLRGRVIWREIPPGDQQGALVAHFGIESFFVPEGTGRPIEDQRNEGKVQVVLAVAPDGEAAIRALIVDGERLEEPPLF